MKVYIFEKLKDVRLKVEPKKIKNVLFQPPSKTHKAKIQRIKYVFTWDYMNVDWKGAFKKMLHIAYCPNEKEIVFFF